MALALVRHDPRVARHIDDRVVAGDEVVSFGELFVQRPAKPRGLLDVALNGIRQRPRRVLHEMVVLPSHRQAAHANTPLQRHNAFAPFFGMEARVLSARYCRMAPDSNSDGGPPGRLARVRRWPGCDCSARCVGTLARTACRGRCGWARCVTAARPLQGTSLPCCRTASSSSKGRPPQAPCAVAKRAFCGNIARRASSSNSVLKACRVFSASARCAAARVLTASSRRLTLGSFSQGSVPST